jgi:N4-(beta-N-acetylglucosaminyl)-L-asparaginase
MTKKISRRHFFNRSFGLGAGMLLFKNMGFSKSAEDGKIPIIITSHTNKTGQKAMGVGWEILKKGGSAVDAVEKAANVIELDPKDRSVGYGGFPNEEGIVQLDASIMDGKTYNAGAVGCLENIKTPSSVARIIMERTDHVMLVGQDALRFEGDVAFEVPAHGTTNVLAIDANGDIAGITTTSGLGNKIPGRVGDSPIIGAGLYVDNEVGAAGATGRGEDVIKSCATYYIIMRMKQGRTPQQACEDALKMIVEKYKKVNPDFFPGEKFVAINKKGDFGCSNMPGRRKARLSVINADGLKIYTGTALFY